VTGWCEVPLGSRGSVHPELAIVASDRSLNEGEHQWVRVILAVSSSALARVR
jgi:hypothetical protein